jgi:hypothetical protein
VFVGNDGGEFDGGSGNEDVERRSDERDRYDASATSNGIEADSEQASSKSGI